MITHDLADDAGTNGTATLTDSETQALSIATGVSSSTCITTTLSPGMHIPSLPAG